VKPLGSIFRIAFGCHHRQRSGVFTIKKRTYQVCLKCGQEFEYSWALMHSIRSSVADSPHGPLPSNNVRTNNVRPHEAPVS
jgi:hypothetical protein